MGIATVALIDSTVRVTTRQSDSVPNASEVAMAPSQPGRCNGRTVAFKADRAG